MAYFQRISQPLIAAAACVAVSASAQGVPRELTLGRAFDGTVAPTLPDCFQLDIPKGEKVVAALSGADFPHMVQVMRGARCDADVAQFEDEGKAGARTAVPFTSVGGRYLVVVRAITGGGSYQLDVAAAAQPKPEAVAEAPVDAAATAAAAGLPPEATAGLDIPPPPPAEPEVPVDPKVALMKKQLLAYNIQKAEDEARAAEQRRQEAEQRRRDAEERERQREQARIAQQEREQANQQMWGAIFQGVQQVGQAYVEARQERFEAQSRLNELAAARDREIADRRAVELRQQQQAAAEKQAADRAVLARTLANANAQRDAMIARTTDPRAKAQLEMWNQKTLETARQYGIENEVRQQSGRAGGQQVAGGSPAQAAAQEQQQRQQQELARREESARLQQAEAKRQADAKRAQEAAARQQEEQRKQQEAARKEQEAARVAAQRMARMNNRASGGMSTVGLGAVEKGATPPGSGELSRQVSQVGGCQATGVNVRYNLSALMGEAVVSGSWSWQGEEGCSAPHTAKVWLRLQAGSAYGYVELNPAVPDANKGFGYNSPGSPSWSRLVCGFSGSGPTSCMSDAQARSIWAMGEVVGFEVGW